MKSKNYSLNDTSKSIKKQAKLGKTTWKAHI